MSSARLNPLWLIIVGIFPLILTGCVTLNDPETSQETITQVVGVVDDQTTVGQTISPQRSKINGVTIWLSKSQIDQSQPENMLTARVFTGADYSQPEYTTNISTSAMISPTPVRIDLPSELITENAPFYLELSSPGIISVYGCLEDCYSGGQAYVNGQPIQVDLAFRVSYRYDTDTLLADEESFSPLLDTLLPLLGVVFMPGYSLVRLLRLHQKYSWGEQVAASIGFSLALFPVIYLIGSVAQARISLPILRIVLVACSALILASFGSDRSVRSLLKHCALHRIYPPNKKSTGELLVLFALFSIFGVALLVRMIMIRDLATPAWVDSIHHGLITRLIIETGAYPKTYAPYLEIEPTLYHPGFHTSLAAFIQLANIDIPEGMLIFGQVINALIIFPVFLLARTITRSSTAGIFAALIAGLLTPMPAYYTSWGRYPQLAGLLILPVPFSILIKAESSNRIRHDARILIGCSLVCVGLALVHYRATAFLLCLLMGYLLSLSIHRRPFSVPILRNTIIRLGIIGLLSAIFISPWLIPFINNTFLPRISPIQTENTIKAFSDFSWQYLTPARGKQAMVLAILGLCWAIINHRRLVLMLVSWVGLMFLLANLASLNLPGGNFINNSSVAIMLFMPISVAGGYFCDQLARVWQQVSIVRWQIIVNLLILSVAMTVALLGARSLLPLINPITILSRSEDLPAIDWVDQNIPEDETILINPFNWGYGLYGGTDGGAWIPTIAGNPTLPPPVLYGFGSRDTIDYVNRLCETIFALAASPDELAVHLLKQDIEYIFIGERGGVISPASLALAAHFETLYHKDDVWVFHISP